MTIGVDNNMDAMNIQNIERVQSLSDEDNGISDDSDGDNDDLWTGNDGNNIGHGPGSIDK